MPKPVGFLSKFKELQLKFKESSHRLISRSHRSSSPPSDISGRVPDGVPGTVGSRRENISQATPNSDTATTGHNHGRKPQIPPKIVVHYPNNDRTFLDPTPQGTPQQKPRPQNGSNGSTESQESISTERSQRSGEWDRPFLPFEVNCTLYVHIPRSDNSSPNSGSITFPLKWNCCEKSFENLERKAAHLLIDLLWPHHPYTRRNGICQIIAASGRREPPLVVQAAHEWDSQVVPMICKFASDNPYVPFQLEVRWDYEDFETKCSENRNFAENLRMRLCKETVLNFEGKRYIARDDLEKIMTQAVIKKLIDAEDIYSDPDKDSFKKISLHAPKLLALCVYAKRTHLFKKLYPTLKDENLPLQAIDCPVGIDRIEFEHFCAVQGCFLAHEFENSLSIKEVRKEAVLPLKHNPSKEAKDFLGEGQSGDVYETTIDSTFHSFKITHGPIGVFAVKTYNSDQADTFYQEVDMVKQLAVQPHDHIVYHLAAFKQEQQCYMLLPKAMLNLGKMIQQKPKPIEMNAASVLWLIGQAQGLSAALQRIHAFDVGAYQLQGYHHDIKPGNILVFLPPSAEWDMTACVLKIADFGCGKIRKIRNNGLQTPYQKVSIVTRTERGTPVYQGPDYTLYDKVSPLGDIWSLGCVLLELLNWFFILGPDPDDKFAEERRKDVDCQDSWDLFWMRDPDSQRTLEVKLRPSVKNKIDTIRRDYCKGKPAFAKLISLVEEALEVDPKNRIDATYLADELLRTSSKVKEDLSRDTSCYKRDGAFNTDGNLILKTKNPKPSQSEAIWAEGWD